MIQLLCQSSLFTSASGLAASGFTALALDTFFFFGA
jgi:hypothetical protein